MDIYERAARLVGLGIAAEVVLLIAAVAAGVLRYPQAASTICGSGRYSAWP
jgi:hypothetical protein